MSVSTIAIAAVMSATGTNAASDPVVVPVWVELAEAGAVQPGEAPPQAATTARTEPTGDDLQAARTATSDGIADDPPPADPERKSGARKDILVEGEVGPPPGDPLENVNVQTFEVVQAVDKALVEPAARGYMAVLPKPVRKGVHNVVTNLDEPITFLSFLLQFKFGKALETLGRFAINSTVGIGGLIDVAKRKPFNLPHRENSLGHTLAFYGVGPGPFLYLPLIGSTTLRDFAGQMAAIPILPLTIGKPFNNPAYVIPKVTISGIDERVEDDPRIQTIRAQSSNPYAVYRSYYLRKRQAEVDVLKGLRDNADVPVFEDDPDKIDAGGVEPASSSAPAGDSPPEESPPTADAPQVPVDEAAVLAE